MKKKNSSLDVQDRRIVLQDPARANAEVHLDRVEHRRTDEFRVSDQGHLLPIKKTAFFVSPTLIKTQLRYVLLY